MADTPYTYDQVNEAYAIAQARHPETFSGMDLRGFSRYMNTSLGTDRYRVGDVGPIGHAALQASGGLTDLLQPVSEFSGRVGESVGGVFGKTSGRIGKNVGESLPRTAVDLGLILGGAAVGPAGYPAVATGLGSIGAQTFSETGSVPAAAVSTGTAALMPFAGRAAGSAA